MLRLAPGEGRESFAYENATPHRHHRDAFCPYHGSPTIHPPGHHHQLHRRSARKRHHGLGTAQCQHHSGGQRNRTAHYRIGDRRENGDESGADAESFAYPAPCPDGQYGQREPVHDKQPLRRKPAGDGNGRHGGGHRAVSAKSPPLLSLAYFSRPGREANGVPESPPPIPHRSYPE